MKKELLVVINTWILIQNILFAIERVILNWYDILVDIYMNWITSAQPLGLHYWHTLQSIINSKCTALILHFSTRGGQNSFTMPLIHPCTLSHTPLTWPLRANWGSVPRSRTFNQRESGIDGKTGSTYTTASRSLYFPVYFLFIYFF